MLDHQLPEIDRDELLLLQASVRDSSVTHHIRVSSAIAEHIETELANMTSAVGHIRIDGAIGYTAYLTVARLQNLQSLTFDVEQPPFLIESIAPPRPEAKLHLSDADAGLPNWSTTVWLTGRSTPLNLGMLHDGDWQEIVTAIERHYPFAVFIDGDGERSCLRIEDIDFLLALDHEQHTEGQIAVIGGLNP